MGAIKPQAVKDLEGNLGKRPPRNAPKGSTKIEMPMPPDELGPWGQEVWNKFGPSWYKKRVITEEDMLAWLTMCESYNRYKEAEVGLKEKGLVEYILSASEVVIGSKKSPYLAIMDQQLDRFMPILKQFGMTPIARESITAKESSDDNPFNSFLDN